MASTLKGGQMGNRKEGTGVQGIPKQVIGGSGSRRV